MNKRQLLKSFQDLKVEIEKLRKKHVVKGLVDRFQSERKTLEKKIEKTVSEEVKKAKKFMNEQKKELDKIQKKVEVVLKKKKTAKKKTTAKKAPARKKTTKKAASK